MRTLDERDPKAVFRSVLLALVALASVAHTDPVPKFSVQLKDVKADGRYTIVFSSNSYDTSGEQPPQVMSNLVRFAAGVSIRRDCSGGW